MRILAIVAAMVLLSTGAAYARGSHSGGHHGGGYHYSHGYTNSHGHYVSGSYRHYPRSKKKH